RNRSVSTPGAELDGVLQLRTVDDSDRIRAAAQRGRRAVVVGLGFIGSEVAASLRQLGVEVTALAPERAPLARVLGAEVGEVLAGIHREKGVELVLGDSAAAFEGSGRVERVRTTNGRVIEADFGGRRHWNRPEYGIAGRGRSASRQRRSRRRTLPNLAARGLRRRRRG